MVSAFNLLPFAHEYVMVFSAGNVCVCVCVCVCVKNSRNKNLEEFQNLRNPCSPGMLRVRVE